MMRVYFLNREQLSSLIANARWFAGYWVKSKNIGPDRYRVTTNYSYIVE
jgi:hypothetical protein